MISQLFIFLLYFSVADSSVDEKILLNKGLTYEAEGKYEHALEVWSTAFTVLEDPSLAIGREYIRLVTEYNFRDHFDAASSIYMWGLTAETIEPNREALALELAVLRPLTDRKTYRQWRILFEEDNPDLYRMLLNFWQKLNPTPATRYNERLIEHWERIAYAREHFTRRNDPPYGTDDRGPVFIQYGEPDRKSNGNLYVTRGQSASLSQTLDPQANHRSMADIIIGFGLNPYFEIWVYDQPDTRMEYNLIMIFGDNPRGGFGQVQTIEDFIPSQAFTFDQSRYGVISQAAFADGPPGIKLNPGMIFQLYFYQQLIPTDFFFAHQFDQMVFDWERLAYGDPSLGKHSGRIQMQRHQMRTLQNLNRAPNEMSTYGRVFPSIPVRAYHYRLLDVENRPVTATFLESRPRHAFLDDLSVNDHVMYSDESVTAETAFDFYELTHGLQITGTDGSILSQSRIHVELLFDFREDLPSSSVFTVPQTKKDQQVLLYAELHNRHPDSNPRTETPFPATLRGLGKLEDTLPEPLSSDPNTLEMADLILGYQMRQSAPAGTLVPFVVANNREIPEGGELALHLELYNLKTGENGFSSFQIHYEIQPVRQMDWLLGQKHEFSLTLNLETTGSRYVEDIEILTRELKPGRYKLLMRATDTISGQQTGREIEFQVVEEPDQDLTSVN